MLIQIQNICLLTKNQRSAKAWVNQMSHKATLSFCFFTKKGGQIWLGMFLDFGYIWFHFLW